MGTVGIVLLFALGLFLIVKGGDIFVDAASWIAEVSGIPKFIIGATIVSLATTLPEVIVSVLAALQGKNAIAVGNAVGSVTANVGLIMGISILFLPAAFKRAQFAFKSILMVAACLILVVFAPSGQIGLWPSLALCIVFGIFLAENISEAKKGMREEEKRADPPDKREKWKNILKFLLGTAGIGIGAQLLVDNGSALARILHVPESIIGVTIIAIGTSLPELVTTITALVKRQASLSIGNIIGANVIDLAIILPLCSLLSGQALPISAQTASLDLPVCLGVILVAVVPTLLFERFRRWQGIVMIGGYIAYLVVLCGGMV